GLLRDGSAGGADRDRASLPRAPGSYLEGWEGDVKGLPVAWTAGLGYARVDSRVAEICGDAAAEFESLGCHVEVVNPGWEDPEAPFSTMIAAQFYAAWSDRLPEAEAVLDPTLVKFIRRGGGVTAREDVLALQRVEPYWREVQAFLERVDLLLMPTVAVPPSPAGGAPPRETEGEPVSV